MAYTVVNRDELNRYGETPTSFKDSSMAPPRLLHLGRHAARGRPAHASASV